MDGHIAAGPISQSLLSENICTRFSRLETRQRAVTNKIQRRMMMGGYYVIREENGTTIAARIG